RLAERIRFVGNRLDPSLTLRKTGRRNRLTFQLQEGQPRLLMRKPRRRRPQPDQAINLAPVIRDCPQCQSRTSADYHNFRTVTTPEGPIRITLLIRRCPNPDCPRFLRPYRPEAEPHFAWPYHEFGLDVMTVVGYLRSAEHRSIPEIHRELTRR